MLWSRNRRLVVITCCRVCVAIFCLSLAGSAKRVWSLSARQRLRATPGSASFFLSVSGSALLCWRNKSMCRNIKPLFNFDPPTTEEEIRAASLQFVRKISGFTKPSKANEAAFLAAIDDITGIATRLLRSLETTAPPKNRDEEAAKAKARAAERFGT